MAHGGEGCIFRRQLQTVDVDILRLMAQMKLSIENLLEDIPIPRNGELRAAIVLCLDWAKQSIEAGTQNLLLEICTTYFTSGLQSAEHFNEWYADVWEKILEQISNFTNTGSGWTMRAANFVDIYVAKTPFFSSKKGRGDVVLPGALAAKKAVINVRGTGTRCFFYAVLAALKYKEFDGSDRYRRQRASSYDCFMHELNIDETRFANGVLINQISSFERLNPHLAIQVLEWLMSPSEDELYFDKHIKNNLVLARSPPARIFKDRQRTLINLLFLETGTEYGHFCAISSLNRLLGDAKSRQRLYCDRCFRVEYNTQSMERHRQECYAGKALVGTLPHKGEVFKFRNFRKTTSPSHVAYGDFETIQTRCDDGGKQVFHHKPLAAGLLVLANEHVRDSDDNFKISIFNGPECVQQFVDELCETGRRIYFLNKRIFNMKMNISPRQEAEFQASTRCMYCGKRFKRDRQGKFVGKYREHSHLSGKFLGSVCPSCNSSTRSMKNMFYCVIHNTKNFDTHLLLKYADWNDPNIRLSVLSESCEKYKAVTIFMKMDDDDADVPDGDWEDNQREKTMQIVIVDSFQHLSSSLDSLSKNLPEESLVVTKHLRDLYPNVSDEVIRSKGVFPYEAVATYEDLQARQFPPREACFSALKQEECTEENYARALRAWREFSCVTMMDYCEAYLILDIVLLADVFETYRKTNLNYFGLDSVNYITAPSLSIDCCLYSTRAQIELIWDKELFEYVNYSVRGGMTSVVKHFSQANFPEMGSEYREDLPLSYLVLLDANSLYSTAMCEKLPVGDYQKLSPAEIETLDILSLDPNGDHGYFLLVDFDYPIQLQDKTCDMPFGQEKVVVDESYLTEFMKTQWEIINGDGGAYPAYEKLLCNFYPKENYGIHFRLLQFYMRHGLNVTGVRQAYRFQQRAFLRPYIQGNIERRKQAANDFEKNYWKLMSNSVFGKFLERVENRKKFCLANTQDRFHEYVVRPTHRDFYIYQDSLTGHSFDIREIVFNRPVHVGQSILDISKEIVYSFRYDYLKRLEQDFPGSSITSIGGDTDSLLLEVTGVNYYRDLVPRMLKDQVLDTSNFPHTHPHFSTSLKGRLSCWKDEAPGENIIEAILLNPKVYSLLFEGGTSKRRCKGVSKTSVAHFLTHEHYRRAYQQLEVIYTKTRRIGSRLHDLFTTEEVKKSLLCLDDKRAWLSPNYSVPYGYHKLEKTDRPPKRDREPIAPRVIGEAGEN